MNLAESTVMNAIEHSMSKNCYANIVLAGPIGVGKRGMATGIAKWLNAVTFDKTVSVFSEEDYLKDYYSISLNHFGGKDIDSLGAYEIRRYLSDANSFVNEEYEHVGIPRDLEKEPQKVEHIYGLKPKGKVKIFTGPHAIWLLKASKEVEIPNAIYIFMNADLKKCIQRRIKNSIMIPDMPEDDTTSWEAYYDYVIAENERYILPQMKIADIVVNINL